MVNRHGLPGVDKKDYLPVNKAPQSRVSLIDFRDVIWWLDGLIVVKNPHYWRT
jgi:hypothetical protein